MSALPAALKSRMAAAVAGGVMAVTAVFVTWYEGSENVPYRDPVGIWTVCAGHTATVDRNRVYTDEECLALLERDLAVAVAPVDRLVKVPLGDPTRIALVSFVFNVGEGAFARSTLLRRLNAGDGAAACDELLRWTYAGGKQLPGLVNRRAAERDLCREGFERLAAANDNVPIPLAPPVRACRA